MQIKYDYGPDTVAMGIAGEFRRGEPREVSDEIAAAMLKKKSIKFVAVETREKPKK